MSSEVETRPHRAASLDFARDERHWLVFTALLLLTACGSADDAVVEGSQPLACQYPGQSGFKMECTVDRMETPDGPVLTARGPDGGFRRFLIVKDGRGVIAADGADPVTVKPIDADHIEVMADGVRYKLPARVKP